MSSDSASSEVTYTSISSHGDPLAWAVDFFRLQEPDVHPELHRHHRDYVFLGGPPLRRPSQATAPIEADYIPGPDLIPGYVADSDPEEDPEEDSEDGPVDYPADRGDDDDDDSSDDDKEEEEASEEEEAEEEEEEHLAPADSVVAPIVDHVPSSEEIEPFETDESAATPPAPPTCRTTARISIRPEVPVLLPPEEEVERLLALPTPPPSPLTSLSSPSTEERLARCLAAPALPSSPLPRLPHPYGSPNHVRAPLGFRAAMGRLRASSPLPPPVPAALPLPPLPSPPLPSLPSSPLPPLPDSLFIPPVEPAREISRAELPTIVKGHLAMTLGEIRALQAREQARADAPEGTASTVVGPVLFSFISCIEQIITICHQKEPLLLQKIARVAAAAAAAPRTAAVVEQLVADRVSTALANHDTLRKQLKWS
ncbi:hypothetical protein Tco_1185811 [Tanacetum coccineum]